MDPIPLRYIGGVDSKNEHYGLYADNHNGYYAAPSHTRSYIIYSTTNLTDVIDFLKDLEVRPLPDPSASSRGLPKKLLFLVGRSLIPLAEARTPQW